MTFESCLVGMQFEGRVTKGNASEALADLVDIVHSAEGFSAQQRVTVSLKTRLVHQRPEVHVLMVHFDESQLHLVLLSCKACKGK